MLWYLHGMKQLKLTIQPLQLNVVKWYVDATNAIHDDCKGQTGAIMTLVQGAITSFSHRQKINVESSTEAELIGVDDAMP